MYGAIRADKQARPRATYFARLFNLITSPFSTKREQQSILGLFDDAQISCFYNFIYHMTWPISELLHANFSDNVATISLDII